MDPGGIVLSSLGLAGLTYGFIEAGQKGWSDAAALAAMLAGAAVLAGFVFWERRLGRRAGTARPGPGAAGSRQPLVDLGLFRSAGFTWGTVLTTIVSFALLGILFAMPQYFQDVRGLDALASGVRLLPLIGGMIAGIVAATYLQGQSGGQLPGAPRASVKTLVTAGLAVMAAGLVTGTFTHVTSRAWFVAVWFVVAGIGLGLAMPTATNTAMGALAPERSGSGSAVISSFRLVGATLGVAVLGTVLSSAYRSHLTLAGSRLPPPVPSAAASTTASRWRGQPGPRPSSTWSARPSRRASTS